MEVRILHKFHDKADYNKVYLVGETITFEDTRAEYLIGLGLAERIVEEIAEEAQAEIAEEAQAEPEVVVEEAPEEEVIPDEEPKHAGIQPIKTTTRRRVAKDN